MYVPGLIEKMGNRGGLYETANEINPDLHEVYFVAPTRGLIGFRGQLINDTKGTATME